jgi:hypothetical protein
MDYFIPPARKDSGRSEGKRWCVSNVDRLFLLQGRRVNHQDALPLRSNRIEQPAIAVCRRAPKRNARLDAAEFAPRGRVEHPDFFRCGHRGFT